jgi:hypothetical protein
VLIEGSLEGGGEPAAEGYGEEVADDEEEGGAGDEEADVEPALGPELQTQVHVVRAVGVLRTSAVRQPAEAIFAILVDVDIPAAEEAIELEVGCVRHRIRPGTQGACYEIRALSIDIFSIANGEQPSCVAFQYEKSPI